MLAKLLCQCGVGRFAISTSADQPADITQQNCIISNTKFACVSIHHIQMDQKVWLCSPVARLLELLQLFPLRAHVAHTALASLSS